MISNFAPQTGALRRWNFHQSNKSNENLYGTIFCNLLWKTDGISEELRAISQGMLLNALPTESTPDSFLLLLVRKASWKSKSIMSCSNIWYIWWLAWFMSWPVFLLTCCAAVWDLQRDENNKHKLTIPHTYKVTSRTPLILRDTSLSLAASA